MGLCSAIYSCSNGEVEKHICGFKCMTIRPLHLDINSEVFYVNICGFILQQRTIAFGVHSPSDASSAFGSSLP